MQRLRKEVAITYKIFAKYINQSIKPTDQQSDLLKLLAGSEKGIDTFL